MTTRFHLARAVALADPGTPDGRLCAFCGDYIDPVFYCTDCAAPERRCAVHPRPRKRADAAFCGQPCRGAHRASWARDCLPFQ